MSPMSVTKLAPRYVPVLAALLAGSLFVATVPSRPAAQVNAGGGFEIPDASGGAVGPSGGSRATADGRGGAGGGGVGAADDGSATGVPGVGGASGGAANGPSGGGAGAALDCSRNKVVFGPTCRPAKWHGDNGGATAAGVTKSKVTIVLYEPKRNEQVQAILTAAGTASVAQNRDVTEAYERFFNASYETYGRHVDVVYRAGPGDATPPAAQADAASIATDDKAFAAGCGSCIQAWHDELVRRQRVNFTVIVPFPAEYYTKNAPYVFGILPDFDYTTAHAAQYYCRRLHGRKAVHAGSEALRTPRRLGIIAIDTDDDPGGRFKRAVEACGGDVAGVVKYSSDTTTAQQQATNAILQLQQDGANIVTCVCDPVAPVFFTAAATQQNYQPEWMHNGLFATDSVKASRLYDPEQWGRSFGVTSIAMVTLMRDTPYYNAYVAGGGKDKQAVLNAGGSILSMLLSIFSAIELAGPGLTNETFTRALLTTPQFMGSNGPGASRQSFGRLGPSPFTRADDLGEIWWDPDRIGPDGKPGFFFYVEGGRRRLLGEWPSTAPNVFVNDGSPQTPRDPDV